MYEKEAKIFDESKRKEIIAQYQTEYKNGNIDYTEYSKERKTMFLFSKKLLVIDAVLLLLATICKGNDNIQEYYYTQIYDWLYLSKYITQAVDCTTSITGENFSVIQKFSEEAKVVLEEDEDTNFLSFYKNVAVTAKPRFSDPNPLRFYRAVCTYDDQGVFDCQESLYKLLEKESTYNAFFMKTFIEGENFYVQPNGNESEKIELEKFISDEKIPQFLKDYIVQQIFFVSDLTMTRNISWKKKFELIYPAKSVFSFCFNKKFPANIRAGFASMATHLYLDHEPQEEKEFPQLFRIFNNGGKNSIEEEEFEYKELVNSIQKGIISYLSDFSEKIIKQINQNQEEKKMTRFFKENDNLLDDL